MVQSLENVQAADEEGIELIQDAYLTALRVSTDFDKMNLHRVSIGIYFAHG